MTASHSDNPSPQSNQTRRSVRVHTGSRLHFGLLDTLEPYGGVGMMIDDPVTEVFVTASDHFQCDPKLSARLKPIAKQIMAIAKLRQPPTCRVDVIRRATPHIGLGSGTQLAMAAAEAMAQFVGIDTDPKSLAIQIAQRGERSAIGVHGYFVGGLIYEQADVPSDLNPLRCRVELPNHWCVAVLRPRDANSAVSGDRERQQFARLSAVDRYTVEKLKQSIVKEIVPAASGGIFETFVSSVERYNRQSGMLFAKVQGGPYNGPAVTRLIERLNDQGARGVGQSSWGPGVFTWFESTSQAKLFIARLTSDTDVIATTHPRNHGRVLLS